MRLTAVAITVLLFLGSLIPFVPVEAIAQTKKIAPSNIPLPTVGKAGGIRGGSQTGVLRLPDGSKFQTTLYELKVIGQLRTAHKLPYYILSGVGCQECDSNVSIYILSLSDGPMHDEGTQMRFDYPGQQISREDKRVVSETRVFIGNCTAGHPDAVVWFERYIGED